MTDCVQWAWVGRPAYRNLVCWLAAGAVRRKSRVAQVVSLGLHLGLGLETGLSSWESYLSSLGPIRSGKV